MHELSITQSMLDLVLKQAKEAGAKEVEKINLVIGEMTGIGDESVRFYFNLLNKGTIAEGASLSFKTVATTARCRSCDNAFRFQESGWTCPACGNNDLEIIGGRELSVESIDVE